MKQYLELMRRIRTEGVRKGDRTDTGTLSVFGHQMRFDLARGFPLVTTKKLHLRSLVYELLWFLRGDTNVAWLREHEVTIWDEWADEHGELGPVYGRQWRAWPAEGGRTIDQIAQAVERLRSDPDSRRIMVSAWNVGELERMRLMPCHAFFSSTWPRDACPVSSTSAARTCFSAYRSTSPATRCSRTCSRSNAISSPASSSGPAATATCT